MAHHRPWPRQIAETDDEADDDDEVGNYDEMGDEMGDNDKVDEGNEVDDDNEVDNSNQVDNDAEMDNKDHSDGPEPPRKCVKHTQHTMMLSQPSFVSIQVHGSTSLNVQNNIFAFGWLMSAHLLNMKQIFQTHNVL